MKENVIMLIRFNVKNFLSFSANEDGKSEEFYEYLDQHKNDINYIVVCCGNQKMNNEI